MQLKREEEEKKKRCKNGKEEKWGVYKNEILWFILYLRFVLWSRNRVKRKDIYLFSIFFLENKIFPQAYILLKYIFISSNKIFCIYIIRKLNLIFKNSIIYQLFSIFLIIKNFIFTIRLIISIRISYFYSVYFSLIFSLSTNVPLMKCSIYMCTRKKAKEIKKIINKLMVWWKRLRIYVGI